MNFDGQWYKGKPGHVFYVPANKVHQARNASQSDCVFFTCKDSSHGLHGTKRAGL
jgi:quercetin dioxygenase-like cupin family protein